MKRSYYSKACSFFSVTGCQLIDYLYNYNYIFIFSYISFENCKIDMTVRPTVCSLKNCKNMSKCLLNYIGFD